MKQFRSVAMTTSLCTTLRSTQPLWSSLQPYKKVVCTIFAQLHIIIIMIIMILYSGGGDHQLLPSSINQITGLNERAHTLAFDIIFAQLKEKLSKVPQLKVPWLSQLIAWKTIHDHTRSTNYLLAKKTWNA